MMEQYTALSAGSVIGRVLYCTLVIPLLISCGGGGGGGGASNTPVNNSNTSGGWVSGVFLSANAFDAMCVVPVPGTNDRQGTATDENNFLRSYSNNTYLWYDEIVDVDPALHSTPAYFDLLKTTALTPSGKLKDKFHFTIPTAEWNALSQSGISAGYGAQFAILQGSPPRLVVVAYTEPNSPATSPGINLARGAQILTVDGVNVANGSNVDGLNAGLFPATAGESHTFTVRDLNGTVRSFTMQSAVITSAPVQNVSVIPTGSGNVGYLLFNDHIATAEGGLYNAVTQLAGSNITDLVIDIRYNGGGFLDIASEFAYMIAGPARTAGRTFELIKFNNKHPQFDPVTRQQLLPIPFRNRTLGFDSSLPAGNNLPTLNNLLRVYVLTGSGTCSASESIINSLRGVDVQVVQIGSTTCGKPYGFYPTDNCGTTYFTVQFQGVNAKGFGDYTDGFSPANTVNNVGTVVPGCSVADDFSHALGDPAESRLAAALSHRTSGGCPVASGFSTHTLSALPQFSTDNMVVPKSAWQQNRIMDR